MFIEFLISILALFLLLGVEHFLVAFGFFSFWSLLVIYLYGKTEKLVFWVFLMLTGIFLGVTTGLGIYVYIFSITIAIFLLLVIKKFIPDDNIFSRYIPYIISFFTFYILRDVLGEFSVSRVLSRIDWNDIFWWFVYSLISTVIIALVDRIYTQFRTGGRVSGRGLGIEIRRV